MQDRFRSEEGWVLVTSMLVLVLMLAMGAAALGLADQGTSDTRQQRGRESALALDEGVLHAQGFVLASKWPTAADPYPASCTELDLPTNAECPNRLTLSRAQGGASANFQDVDHLTDAVWKTKVRDNGGAWLNSSYDALKADLAQTGCPLTPCTYDANEDKRMWVQSRSVVRGKARNVVALLQLEELAEAVPQAGVVAGGIDVSNNGNHGGTPIIDASGSQVIVRCNPATTNPSSACVDYVNGQISPAPVTGAQPNLMTAEQLARMKARAITDGRYYPGCPTKNASNKYDLNGQVVWVENCYSSPNIANNNVTVNCTAPSGMSGKCVNTVAKPGILIWHCGASDLQSSFTYIGVWYMANNSDGTCPSPGALGDGTCNNANDFVMHTNGGFGVWGALNIDGQGCLDVGSNGLQVKYDANAFGGIKSYGTVGLVQNTWRELPSSAGA